MTIIILWFIFSAFVGVYADKKGRSGGGYFFLSLLLSPIIAFCIVALAGEKKEAE